MESPKIPIEIDPDTGIWSTNGLPMIYMPRHFFRECPPLGGKLHLLKRLILIIFMRLGINQHGSGVKKNHRRIVSQGSMYFVTISRAFLSVGGVNSLWWPLMRAAVLLTFL